MVKTKVFKVLFAFVLIVLFCAEKSVGMRLEVQMTTKSSSESINSKWEKELANENELTPNLKVRGSEYATIKEEPDLALIQKIGVAVVVVLCVIGFCILAGCLIGIGACIYTKYYKKKEEPKDSAEVGF